MTRPLPGGHGTVTVADDGRGIVHDMEGRYVSALPAHTVALLMPAPELPAPAPRRPWWRLW